MKRTILNRPSIYITIFLISATFMFSCKNEEINQPNRGKYIIPDSLLKVTSFDTIKKCPIVNTITLTGNIDFDQDHQVNIFPLVSGNIQDIKVQLGDYVTEGQPLALIKSSEMAGYSNNLIVAETNLKAAKKQLDAAEDLYKSGLSSQLDVTNAQVNYDQAIAQLEMVKRVLKINGNNTKGDYIVKAPISGFIVQKNVTNNTAIRADNGSNLFTISDLKNVWVQGNVYESNISKIHVGEPVTVTTVSYPDRVFNGKIDKMVNVLDPANKVMKIRVVLSNEDYALKPQMYANVDVTEKEDKEAFCVPINAVVFDHSKYYVMVYHGKGVADITQVDILSKNNDKYYLRSGVKEDDVIITTNTMQVFDQLNN